MVILSKHLVLVAALLSASTLAAPLRSRASTICDLGARTTDADYGLEIHARTVSDLSLRASTQGHLDEYLENQAQQEVDRTRGYLKEDLNALNFRLMDLRALCATPDTRGTRVITELATQIRDNWVKAFEKSVEQLAAMVPADDPEVVSHRSFLRIARTQVTNILNGREAYAGLDVSHLPPASPPPQTLSNRRRVALVRLPHPGHPAAQAPQAPSHPQPQAQIPNGMPINLAWVSHGARPGVQAPLSGQAPPHLQPLAIGIPNGRPGRPVVSIPFFGQGTSQRPSQHPSQGSSQGPSQHPSQHPPQPQPQPQRQARQRDNRAPSPESPPLAPKRARKE